MDATTITSASEPQSSKLNETATLTMPSSDQHSPDVITETNSSPAAAPVVKSPARSLTTKLKLNSLSPLFGKNKGKDRANGKEKEKEVATTTAPATEDALIAQEGAQEEAGAAKKGGWLKKSPIRKVTRKVISLFG